MIINRRKLYNKTSDFEQNFDMKVITTIASLYKELDDLCDSLGHDVVVRHAPELYERTKNLKNYIDDYARKYHVGLGHAEYMTVSEIEETVKKK